jgi:cytidine deaminase
MTAPHDLLNAALAARANAHAPYSGYAVGAALRTAEGAVHAGANVENAAYPEGCCAETAAIAAMVAAGGRRIAELCVIGPDGSATAPCGGCCQRLAEFAGPATPVHMRDAAGGWRAVPLRELLPQAFSVGRDAGR